MKTIYTCVECGKVFEDYVSKPRTSCSRVCKNKHWAKIMLEKRISKEGKHRPIEVKNKLSNSLFGRFRKRFGVNCQICNKRFEVWPSYVKRSSGKFCSKKCFGLSHRNNINELSKFGRPGKINKWKMEVMNENGMVCKMCGLKNVKFEIHHILPYSKFPEFRFDKKNGVVLCHKCHSSVQRKEWLYAPKFLGI